jgi:hypothetical protein
MTKTQLIASLDKFTRSYLESMLWAETDNHDETGGMPLDRATSYRKACTLESFTIPALVEARADCRDFQKGHRDFYLAAGWGDAQAGHDFYLTRNGHGCGFWDRGRTHGDALTDAAHVYGTQGADLYRGRVTLHG